MRAHAPAPDAADRLAALYEEEGPQIFDASLLKTITSLGGVIDERYDARELVKSLQRHLGDTRLGEAVTGILVTVYDLDARQALVLRRDDQVSMVDAAHASSAAPTYFEPVRLGARTLIDGGVFAINPAILAYAEANGRIDVLASLGTGEQTRRLPYDEVKDWGQIEGPGRSSTSCSTEAPTWSTLSRTADRKQLHPAADPTRRGLRRSRRREPGEPRCAAPRGRAADRRAQRRHRPPLRSRHVGRSTNTAR